MLYNTGSMWPSVVVHEHWPVSQRMIVEMGNYAWSEHIVTVFVACQITIKNVEVNCGRFMGRRARTTWWRRRLITVRVLMWPPNAKLPLSAPAVLNGRCRVRLDMSRFSLGVVLRGLPSRGRSVAFPVLTKTLHQSYNDRMINHEVVCHPSMAKTTVMHANSLPPFWYC